MVVTFSLSKTSDLILISRASLKLGLDRAVLQSMQQSTGVSGNGVSEIVSCDDTHVLVMRECIWY